MSHKIPATSPRRFAAERFATELRKAMRTRRASAVRVAEAAGASKASVNNWCAGGNLPRVDTAARLAEVLDWPRLVEISREGRTVTCKRCGRDFVYQGGNRATFCGPGCRDIDQQLRRPSAGSELAATLRDELERRSGMRGAVPKNVVSTALARYGKADARRLARVDKQATEIGALREAIGAYCLGCEPEGLCRDSGCPLRLASPLPVAKAEWRVAGELREPQGSWSTEYREKTLEAIRAGNARRWSREGERERQSAKTKAWHAANAETFGALVSDGRRRQLRERAS